MLKLGNIDFWISMWGDCLFCANIYIEAVKVNGVPRVQLTLTWYTRENGTKSEQRWGKRGESAQLGSYVKGTQELTVLLQLSCGFQNILK